MKRIINWNRYHSKVTTERQNQFSDYLIDPRFQGVNKLFVLYFVNKNEKSTHTGYYLPKVDIKDYNVKIDDRNVFDQSINTKNTININTKTYENIRKIPTGQEDEYITG